MSITIKTNKAEVGKKLSTDRQKADGSNLVVCSIKLAFPCTREEVAELTGLPLACIMSFYAETGLPLQHTSLLMTKRELLLSADIARHIPEDQQADLVDPDKQPPKLNLPKALASDMRFVLEQNGAGFRGKIQWKARGDEVEDLEGLLGGPAEIKIKFHDPKLELVKQGGQVQPEIRRITEKPAGKADLADKPGRKKKTARGKDAAAGEGAENNSEVARGTTTGVGPGFAKEAERAAARSPRRPPADKRKH